jgi:Protein of unknown function (DUF3551)
MRTFTLGVLAFAVIVATPAAPANASDRHPWCLVVQDWGDGWACGYDTFAQCLAEARPGNVGYCAANPNYPTPAPAASSRQRRKSR